MLPAECLRASFCLDRPLADEPREYSAGRQSARDRLQDRWLAPGGAGALVRRNSRRLAPNCGLKAHPPKTLSQPDQGQLGYHSPIAERFAISQAFLQVQPYQPSCHDILAVSYATSRRVIKAPRAMKSAAKPTKTRVLGQIVVSPYPLSITSRSARLA